MTLAASRGHYAVAELLVTPLRVVVKCGDMDTIKLLMEAHDDEQFRNDVGPTALLIAAASGHTSAVLYLLDRGLDPEDRYIGEAAENCHLEILRTFIGKGFEFDRTRLDSLLRPLILAACNKHYAVAELLASVGSEMVFQSGYTPALSMLLGIAAFCG